MLDTMRTYSRGWLATIMLVILIGSFGTIWGVQGSINFSSAPRIARVGSENITPEQFQKEFARYLTEMERQSQVKMSASEAKAVGLDREALARLLTRKALLKKAEDLGLNVSTAQVVDELKGIPGLSDGKGGLDASALGRILQSNEMGQDEFVDLVRSDTLHKQLLRAVLSGVHLPPGLESALNRFRLERRTADYVLIDPARAGEIKDPDEATLRKYYTDHAGQAYSIPELRSVTVVTAKAADVASQVQVTDADIKKIYELRKKVYQTPEKRTLEQIRFKTEEKARAAKKKLDGGQSFEEVAKAEGFKPDDIRLGEVSKTDTTIPPIAFELPLNTISEPVKGPFGWVIVRALAMTPASVKTLDEVKQEIKDEISAPRTKDKLSELVNAFEDMRGGGATLEEAAKKYNLPVAKFAAVDAKGNDANGVLIEGLPGGDFLGRLLIAESGVDSELNEQQDGSYYEFRVDKISPATKKPFDAVRAKVLDDWRGEETAKRLQKLAEDLVKRGNGGESMTAIGNSLGVAPLRTDPMPRYGKTTIFGEATVSAAADAKVGKFFSGPVAEGKSIVVARLAEITYAPDADQNQHTTYVQRLQQAFVGDFAQQFSNAVRDEVGVTIDEQRFTAFHNGE